MTADRHELDRLGGSGDTPPFSRRLGEAADRAIERLESERTCWTVLAAAMALSIALGLYLTRGLDFHADDFLYYIADRGLNLRVLIGPHNGHLIFVPRLIYAVGLSLFGARHYLFFRVVEVLGIALVAGLFFSLAKPKVGNAAALFPSVLLLFLGSAWQDTVDPVGMAHIYCIAAGLGALLALRRSSRRTDLAVCALLIVSIATFSVGIMFVLGTMVSVLQGPDRRRRIWIFLVPIVLYVAWLAAPKLSTTPFSSATGLQLTNVLLIPSGMASAAAAAAASLSGLSYDFANPSTSVIDSPWGYVIAAAVVAALFVRVRRTRVSASLWTSLAILLSFWASVALATHYSAEPNQDRYVYDSAVIVLIVAADALAGIRFARGALLVLCAVTVFSLATNIALMRVGSNTLRAPVAADRAELTAVDIARDHVSPRFVPSGEPLLLFLDSIAGGAGPYLAAAQRSGSFGFTLQELRDQPEPVRELADSTLASAVGLHLSATSAPPVASACVQIGGPSGTRDLILRPPGVLLRSATGESIVLRRFASLPTAKVGQLSPRTPYALQIPADRAPDPWHLVMSAPLTVCRLPTG